MRMDYKFCLLLFETCAFFTRRGTAVWTCRYESMKTYEASCFAANLLCCIMVRLLPWIGKMILCISCNHRHMCKRSQGSCCRRFDSFRSALNKAVSTVLLRLRSVKTRRIIWKCFPRRVVWCGKVGIGLGWLRTKRFVVIHVVLA